MTADTRNILVTSALPYANGSIHMGHLVEYIQTDIWVRFQKMKGHNCIYICAADAHGTPIMIKAREENINPEELVERISKQQLRDLNDFGVEFDNFLGPKILNDSYIYEFQIKLDDELNYEMMQKIFKIIKDCEIKRIRHIS